eukprot:scaffold34760_cov171-Skeletonema_menzelii.AAC.4
METPPRQPSRREANDADANATLTPERGRPIVGVNSAATQRNAEAVSVEDSVSNNEYRDEESLSSVASFETNEVECCICLENVSSNNVATLNGCEHVICFCQECVMRWAEISNRCPLCRTRFTAIQLADGVLQRVHALQLRDLVALRQLVVELLEGACLVAEQVEAMEGEVERAQQIVERAELNVERIEGLLAKVDRMISAEDVLQRAPERRPIHTLTDLLGRLNLEEVACEGEGGSNNNFHAVQLRQLVQRRQMVAEHLEEFNLVAELELARLNAELARLNAEQARLVAEVTGRNLVRTLPLRLDSEQVERLVQVGLLLERERGSEYLERDVAAEQIVESFGLRLRVEEAEQNVERAEQNVERYEGLVAEIDQMIASVAHLRSM